MNSQRVALVTGASSGIGSATAAALVQAGFRTFGTARDRTKLGSQRGGVEWVSLDVRAEHSVRVAVNTVLDTAGRIDVLVNNAGIASIGAAEETSIEEAVQIFETNFFGTLRLIHEILPVMRRQRSGRIVNISSVVGFLPAPYMAVYAASKHAIEGYSESLDHELRQFGIRVSLIEPGFTRTDLANHGYAVSHVLEAYEQERNLAADAINRAISAGTEPASVASTIVKAVLDRKPRPRYQAGREAGTLRILRNWAPAALLDGGVRKQFGLSKAH